MKGRWREVDQLLLGLQHWAGLVADVRAVAVIGSYARGTPRLGSDLDLVLLCQQPDRYGPELAGGPPLGSAAVLRRRQCGPLTELRLRRRSGLQLDVGAAATVWAGTGPLDDGTARVLRDGLQAIHDPDRLLSRGGRRGQEHPRPVDYQDHPGN